MRIPPTFVLGLLLFACAGPDSGLEQSVRPGINKNFLDPELRVGDYVKRFEGESREVFANRARIARTVGLEPGMRVADVGAGTGLFTEMFAKDVGPEGVVWAIDISEKFIEHLRARAEQRGLKQVRTLRCSERDVLLPAEWIDRAFVCDTYHHFEYPRSTLASLYRALRPGGELFVVDFERIPGVTREWLLEHVRAGKEVFRAEIEAAGFELVEECRIRGLEENYALRFRRPESDPPLTERLTAHELSRDDAVLPYRLFTPANPSGARLPLVLFLHGAGERGDDNGKQLAWGAWHFVSDAAQRARPCFVAAPQCPSGSWWTKDGNDEHCLALVEELLANHSIDPARVYVTGLSMGGYATWRLAARAPERFAAAVPICGGGDVEAAPALARVPIWAFHGDADRTIDVSESRVLVEAVRDAGGEVRYTEYPGVGHNAWTATYTDPRVHAWMFEQARSRMQ